MRCCCNVKNQKKISTKSFSFREYETRILRVQLTQLDDQPAPGGAKHDALLLLSFVFCIIFDLYKQGPVCAITTSDRVSAPVT